MKYLLVAVHKFDRGYSWCVEGDSEQDVINKFNVRYNRCEFNIYTACGKDQLQLLPDLTNDK